MITNFDKIRTLINFDEGGIYHIQVLQRSKDGHDKSSRIVCEWFVTSNDRFNFIEPAIINLCEIYQARAYINLNGKLENAVLLKIMENGLEQIKNNQSKPIKLLSSAVGQVYSQRKIWIVDVDSKEYDLDVICARIEQCKSGMTRNVIDVLPTVNGFHILTCPFNVQEFQPEEFLDISIHKNNPTLLFAS